MMNKFISYIGVCAAGWALLSATAAAEQDLYAGTDSGFYISEYDQEAFLPDYISLDVGELLQNPELPTGCESVALTILLQYYGFEDLEKTTIAQEYLPYTDNFVTGYVGDPFSEEGAGCYAPAIVRAASAYLRDENSYLEAKDITGSTKEELYALLAEGKPVLVWNTMYLADSVPSGMYEEYEGEEYEWRYNEHCVVLTGYDTQRGIVEVSDPLEGTVIRNADRFWKLYEDMGSMAVVLE